MAGPVVARLLEMETAFEAMARLRKESDAHRAVYFYVTDAEEQLVGVAPARALLFAEPATLVGEIMAHPAISVTRAERFGNALRLMAEQRLLALPVVDEENRLTGVLDISGVTQTIWAQERQREAEESFQIAGVHSESEGKTLRWADRSSLIATSLAAAIVLALVVSSFHAFLSRVIAVAFFIPLMVTLAESAALRSLTRGLRNQLIGRRDAPKFAGLESELRLGSSLAGLAAILVALFFGNAGLGLAVGCSALAAVIAGALLGDSIPRLLRGARVSATIAAGPVVLALAAVTALACYLAVSAAILK